MPKDVDPLLIWSSRLNRAEFMGQRDGIGCPLSRRVQNLGDQLEESFRLGLLSEPVIHHDCGRD
jgi:hypothetical protein